MEDKESESALHCRLLFKRDEEMRQQGRMEVIDWMEKENPFSFIYRSSARYQTKLKEWGIK